MKFLLMMANDIPKILIQEVIDLKKIKNVIFLFFFLTSIYSRGNIMLNGFA